MKRAPYVALTTTMIVVGLAVVISSPAAAVPVNINWDSWNNQNANGPNGFGGGYNVFANPWAPNPDFPDSGALFLNDQYNNWLNGDQLTVNFNVWLEDYNNGQGADVVSVKVDATDAWGHANTQTHTFTYGNAVRNLGWAGNMAFGPWPVICVGTPLACGGVWQNAWTVTVTITLQYWSCGFFGNGCTDPNLPAPPNAAAVPPLQSDFVQTATIVL
jgi:hypothetical protein